MISIDGTNNFPPLMEDCDNETVFQQEFFPTGERHEECNYDTPIFYDIADDLMGTEYFNENFDRFFAIYVLRGCSMCGDIEWYDEENYIPMIYTRLVEDTPENRYRFFGDDLSTDEEEDSSDYSYDPEWEE